MDTNDTTSPDLDTFEVDQIEDISFGQEVAKNFAIATASSAGVFGGFVVIALATPHVKRWLNRKKNNVVVIEGESPDQATPEEK